MKLSEEINRFIKHKDLEIYTVVLEEWLKKAEQLEAHCKEQEMIVKMQREKILKMKCCGNCKHENEDLCRGHICYGTDYYAWELRE